MTIWIAHLQDVNGNPDKWGAYPEKYVYDSECKTEDEMFDKLEANGYLDKYAVLNVIRAESMECIK